MNTVKTQRPVKAILYGCIIVGRKEYNDADIAKAPLNPRWRFGGDQFPEESNIYLKHGRTEVVFGGPTALQDFQVYVNGREFVYQTAE